jgi:hypothetical protein
MNIQTFYKYQIYNKETDETKLFFKYQEVKDYCGIARSTMYKIFNGQLPSKWSKYIFSKVRLPRHNIVEITY